MPIITHTARLIVRHVQPADEASFCDMFGDAEVMRFGDGVQTGTWVQWWIEDCQQQYATHGFGPYSLVERQTGVVIGYCGLFFYPALNGRPEVELGYRLRRQWWGHGYATEAARAVANDAQQRLGIGRLIALIDPSNTASLGVARKLGMRKDGEVMLTGYTHPDYVYVME